MHEYWPSVLPHALKASSWVCGSMSCREHLFITRTGTSTAAGDLWVPKASPCRPAGGPGLVLRGPLQHVGQPGAAGAPGQPQRGRLWHAHHRPAGLGPQAEQVGANAASACVTGGAFGKRIAGLQAWGRKQGKWVWMLQHGKVVARCCVACCRRAATHAEPHTSAAAGMISTPQLVPASAAEWVLLESLSSWDASQGAGRDLRHCHEHTRHGAGSECCAWMSGRLW